MLAILDTDLETGSFLLIVVHGGGTISNNFVSGVTVPEPALDFFPLALSWPRFSSSDKNQEVNITFPCSTALSRSRLVFIRLISNSGCKSRLQFAKTTSA
jgi:hypothetical protein